MQLSVLFKSINLLLLQSNQQYGDLMSNLICIIDFVLTVSNNGYDFGLVRDLVLCRIESLF